MIAIPARDVAAESVPLPGPSHPALRALLGRWQAHCGPRALPCEADLLFFNLKPWLGQVRRIAVIGGRFEPLPCPAARSEPPAERLTAAFRQAAFGGVPVCAMPAPGMEGLVLPFAGDKRQVSLLLVAIYDSLPVPR